MARRKSNARDSEQPITGWAFVLAACGFGVACVAAGVVVMLFGSGYERGGSAVAGGDVTTMGVVLVGCGVVAIGLTIGIVASRRLTGRRRTKGPRRRT